MLMFELLGIGLVGPMLAAMMTPAARAMARNRRGS
jgi:hypothetical protein